MKCCRTDNAEGCVTLEKVIEMTGRVDLVECPRDAMQGWERIIPTAEKVRYLNVLLRAGFHTLDFGSFVSPKAIPQMADTKEVLSGLEKGASRTRLLAIVANTRGAEIAAREPLVNDLGYPFSVSPTFQQRNANSSITESFERLREIHRIADQAGKHTVAYLSMAFGNPYGDPYSEQDVLEWAHRLRDLGIRTLSLADTVGLASAEQVARLTTKLVSSMPEIRIGVHLHSTPDGRAGKVQAAWAAGARRFDGAILGLGGCPMSGNALVGNVDTCWLTNHFRSQGADTGINMDALGECQEMAQAVFGSTGSGH
jgi:hydroxymethylglutaryl-CoA lyase